MSKDERDTHFAGWASSLWQAIEEECRNQAIYLDSGYSSAELLEVMQPLIARAGYDLVAHSVRHTGVQQYDPATGYESKSVEEVIARDIPDMRQWPEEERMHPLISRLREAVERGRSLTEETPIDSEKLRMHWTHEMLPAMLDLWQELVRTDEDAQFIQRQIDDWEKIIPAMTE